ncbi:MAG: aldehyde ferredoxin oxidoreductase N-terminal domain-containing protein [Thermodesulfobacteriota bacterium]|nr:aldehyde ferredoxin oxidoreductase N-terminal domain-containing protein [Thermodesulfobacteriota bacterium]
MGPAGENLLRLGALIHNAGNAAGQGGFCGVLGSKNLRIIDFNKMGVLGQGN